MIRLLTIAVAFCTLPFLAGCPTQGGVVPQTVKQQIAVAYTQVTGARLSALAALKAKKITPDDAANVQKQLDVAREGLDVAQALADSNPLAATNKLEAQLAVVRALQAYLPKE